MAKKDQKYVGFWWRFIAISVDNILLNILFLPVTLIMLSSYRSFDPLKLVLFWILWLITLLIPFLYEIIFTKVFGGTLGKLAIRSKVVDEQGNNLSWGRSCARTFSKILNAFTLSISYLVIAFTPKKQGIHDFISKTFVVENETSRTPRWMRAASIIFVILSILVMFLLTIFFIASAVADIFSFAAGINDVPQNDDEFLVYAEEECGSKVWILKDICYGMHLTHTFSDPQKKLDYCKLLPKESQQSCFLEAAIKYLNINHCDHSPTESAKKQCRKSFTNIAQLADSDLSPSKHGTLSHGSLSYTRFDEFCTDIKISEIYDGDVVCISIDEISGLEPNAQGLYQFESTVYLRDKNNNLVDIGTIIQGNETHELEEGILKNHAIFADTNVIKPGTYTSNIVIRDVISKKNVIIPATLIIKDEKRAALDLDRFVLGRSFGSKCIEQEDLTFDVLDRLCVMPIDAFGFSTNDRGLYQIRLDSLIIDDNTKREETISGYFGDSGYATLSDQGILTNQPLIYPTELFAQGSYTIDLTLIDEISGKKVVDSKNVRFIEKPKGKLEADGARLGRSYVGADYCGIKKLNNVFFWHDSVCIEPKNVTGFSLGKDGKHWFDMSGQLIDEQGDIVTEGYYLYGDAGHGLLPNGILNEEFVIISLEDIEFGTYTFVTIVHDLIGNKEISFSETIEVRE